MIDRDRNKGGDDNTGDGDPNEGSAASLTEALPIEIICKIVGLFGSQPAEWKSLLLTNRTMAAACHATLDPSSDRVRSTGSMRLFGPTLAARLVDRYASMVPRVLDAYRRANASALLVEACRAGNLALVRVLLAGQTKWRIDASYRHNRALLECVRLNSAVGVQLLLTASDRVDPTDHPGATHLGRCALHDEPACRRPSHPQPCDACARDQEYGPWVDSDDDDDNDDDDDGGDQDTLMDDDGNVDMYGGDDPLADTDEDSQDGDHSDDHQDNGNDNDGGDPAEAIHQDGPVHACAANQSNLWAPTLLEDLQMRDRQSHRASATSADGRPLGGGDDDGAGFDYDNLVFGGTIVIGSDGDDDGGGGGGDDSADSDYIDPSSMTDHFPCADDDASGCRRCRSSLRADIALQCGGDDGVDQRDDEEPMAPDVFVWPNAEENEERTRLDAAFGITDDDHQGRRDATEVPESDPAHEATDWMPDRETATNPFRAFDSQEADGYALAVRRTDLRRCVCRGGMTFAIVWLDEQGREIGGRPQGPGSAPLWFLSCEDPRALVANGPLSFLVDRAQPSVGSRAFSDGDDDNTGDNEGGSDDDDRVDDGKDDRVDEGVDDGRGVVFVMPEINEGSTKLRDTDENVADAPYAAQSEAGVPWPTSDTPIGTHQPIVAFAGSGDANDRVQALTDPQQAEPEATEQFGTASACIPDRQAQDPIANDLPLPDGERAHRLSSNRAHPTVCTCASGDRPLYTHAMERWCPLFWGALMSVGVLGQLLAHVTAHELPGHDAPTPVAKRTACRAGDVLVLAVSQMIVFSSASHMGALSDIHAAALDLMLTADAIDLNAHGSFLLAFAADRGCSEVIEMLVAHGVDRGAPLDVSAHDDLALRRALWRYVRLYRPASGIGARLDPHERSSRMCIYAAALIALASAAGLDTGGMEPADAHLQPLDADFVRSIARRVYPGMAANDIGRLRLPPMRPHYPPPFTAPW